jgi:hypothetical protein
MREILSKNEILIIWIIILWFIGYTSSSTTLQGLISFRRVRRDKCDEQRACSKCVSTDRTGEAQRSLILEMALITNHSELTGLGVLDH